MIDRATETGNDRQFCWEQVGKSNRLFRVSQVFAPRDCAEKLLPLYALFSVAEQICSSISDEDIARSKLNWWRNECLQNKPGDSRHPVLKELSRTDALKDLCQESVAGLLDGVESRLYASAPPDMSGLKGSTLEFEPGLLARNGMLQLVRESVHRKEQGGFWWIPLNLLARHGVSREDIVTDPRSLSVKRLLAEIFVAAESWGRLSNSDFGSGPDDISPARHLFAINGLYSRKLKRLKGATPTQTIKGRHTGHVRWRVGPPGTGRSVQGLEVRTASARVLV